MPKLFASLEFYPEMFKTASTRKLKSKQQFESFQQAQAVVREFPD